MMERRFEDALDRRSSSECRLCAGGVRAPARLDLPRVTVQRECGQLCSHRVSEQSLYGFGRALSQLADGGDADLREPRLGGRAHAPHQCHGQRVKELEFGVWIDDDQSIRLRDLRCDFRQVLGTRHAYRHGQAKLPAHASPNRPCDLGRRTEEMRARRNVGEGLVDGDALDGRREIAQDSDRGVTEPLVFAEVSADKYEVGTELPRAPSGHAASYAEGPRFIGRREHDAAADRNRLAAQARVEQLFDRRIKSVEVCVENGGYREPVRHYTHHSADASRDSSSARPTPRRSATGAPAAIRRFSSVVNTRKRSKEATVNASRRAAAGRRQPGGIGGGALASTAALNGISPCSITMSRAQPSSGSRHTTLESASRVNQIARRRASAARKASHSNETCTNSGVHTDKPRRA